MRFDPRRTWPATGLLLGLALLIAFGTVYWFGVQDRARYLRDRNFRLLQVLASQVEQLLDTQARVKIKPALDVAERVRVSVNGDSGQLGLTLVPRDGSAPTATMPTVAPDAALVRQVLTARLAQGAFDTLVLATRGGRVLYAVGRRESDLRSSSLMVLRRAAAMPPAARPRAFEEAAAEEAIELASVPYRLFVQPCCAGDDRGGGLVVLGLVDAGSLDLAAYAVSPVWVLAGVALVMASVVAWVFLKVALVGPRQRVTRADAVQLWASGLFGLGLATILLLTTAAYARLSTDVDRQLEALADAVDRRLQAEVAASVEVVERLRADLAADGCLPEAGMPLPPTCEARARALSAAGPGGSPFIAFSLLAADGAQRVKVAFSTDTQRHISVAERAYFRTLASGTGGWMGPGCPGGCVIEPTMSWTTGKPQVVVALPNPGRALPVAALSVPFTSVLHAELPPGFEFAVIDDEGVVHFHADAQRNEQENLAVETDHDRRLQSLVLSRRAGTLNVSYWGRPYRAHVTPAAIGGWSIVALHGKQPTRALVLEWTMVALLMLAAYVAAWTLVAGGAVAASPVSLAWLWPDSLRRLWYVPLAVLILVLLGAVFALDALLTWRLSTRTIVAVLLPGAAWLVTAVVLLARPPAVGQAEGRQELCRDYHVLASALLLVTAVLPATAFFALSYDRHVEAFVKERQVGMAAVVARASCGDAAPAAVENRYHRVFYGADITCAPASSVDTPGATSSVPDGDAEFAVEEYAPYFTSASVRLRGLAHARARDGSWRSERAHDVLRTTVRGPNPRWVATAASPLPAPFGLYAGRTLAEDSAVPAPPVVRVSVVASLATAGLAVVAWLVVGFVLRRVVLAEVMEPVRAGFPVETTVGQRLLILCDAPALRARKIDEACVLSLGAIYAAADVRAAEAAALHEAERATPTRRLVVADLARPFDDALLVRRKMVFFARLLDDPRHTIVLLSDLEPKDLLALVADAAPSPGTGARWTTLLGALPVQDVRKPQATEDAASSRPGALVRWARAVAAVLAHALRQLPELAKRLRMRGDWRHQLLIDEGRCHPDVASVCDELRCAKGFDDGSLTRDQILEEIGDRAGEVYERLWRECDADERVVLDHVARDGMVASGARRAVRRLLTRDLLRKDPELRLMNESFRRFVLDGACRDEVTALERGAGPSMWDTLRVPLGAVSLLAVVFLLATQRDAFDATVAMAAGVSTAVPTLAKLLSLFVQISPSRGPSAGTPT